MIPEKLLESMLGARDEKLRQRVSMSKIGTGLVGLLPSIKNVIINNYVLPTRPMDAFDIINELFEEL